MLRLARLRFLERLEKSESEHDLKEKDSHEDQNLALNFRLDTIHLPADIIVTNCSLKSGKEGL